MIPQRRSGMDPIMSEALLFLKFNHHLWTIKEVAEALRRVKENKKKQRTQKKMKKHQETEELLAAVAAMRNLAVSVPVMDHSE